MTFKLNKVNLKSLFWIRNQKLNSRNKAPIYCRISLNGQRIAEYSTGVSVDPNGWYAAKQMHLEDNIANMTLKLITNRVDMLRYDLMAYPKEEVDLDVILTKVRGKNNISKNTIKPIIKKAEKISFKYLLDKYFEELDELVQAGQKKANGIRALVGKRKKFELFLETDKSTPTQADYNFVQRYIMWLKKRGECDDYTQDAIALLRNVFDFGIRNNIIKINNPATGVKIQKRDSKNTQVAYFDKKERDAILNTNYSRKILRQTADLFIFQLYTGLNYADLKTFNYSKDVFISENNVKFLKKNREKNDETARQILLPEAESILKKYNYILTVSSNQKYNLHLKEVAKEAKIRKTITSKDARASFGNMLLNEHDLSIETVAATMGHSSTNTTQKYYTSVQDKKIEREMLNMIKNK